MRLSRVRHDRHAGCAPVLSNRDSRAGDQGTHPEAVQAPRLAAAQLRRASTGGDMSGRLGLSSPWARELFPAAVRQEIEATIPEGWIVGVSVRADRAYVSVWPIPEAGKVEPEYVIQRRIAA